LKSALIEKGQRRLLDNPSHFVNLQQLISLDVAELLSRFARWPIDFKPFDLS
jgi:hypothetical protein